MGNLIADRVAFFLKDFPPFTFLEASVIDKIAQSITIQYLDEGQFLFHEQDENTGYCYVLRDGDIYLLKNQEGEQEVVERCEPGDIFGVRSILRNKPFSMSAICKKESLIYAIPKALFEEVLKENQQFTLFFASGYAAGQAVVRGSQKGSILLHPEPIDVPLEYPSNVLTCESTSSILDAAKLMSNRKVSSIIITNAKNEPEGIVTDKDLRNKVIAKSVKSSSEISTVMTCPVITVHPNIRSSEAQSLMIYHHIHHLIVTEDGTPESPVCGIITDHDILLHSKNHPSALSKQIKKAKDIEDLKRLRDQADRIVQQQLEQGIRFDFISKFITKINEIITQKVIEFTLVDFPSLDANEFTWMSLGSSARGEQLIRTDQDHALIYSNGNIDEYLSFAASVSNKLQHLGFEYCPAEVMASNPKWCLTLDEWKEVFKTWIHKPVASSLMHATIFFDFKTHSGNLDLADKLHHFLKDEIKKEPIFLNYLAKNAISNPPALTLFKDFALEKDGEHKGTFDLKKKAIMPLTDAARLLSLEKGLVNITGTVERFKALAKVEPNYSDLMEEAAQAYAILMQYRARYGFKHQTNGRYVDLNELSKLEIRLLKNTLIPINEIRKIIEIRFNLAFFS